MNLEEQEDKGVGDRKRSRGHGDFIQKEKVRNFLHFIVRHINIWKFKLVVYNMCGFRVLLVTNSVLHA